MRTDLSADKRKDPVARLVRDLTAEEMVGWLVKYHGLPEGESSIVMSNLKEQYKWHRLQGRLDRSRPLRTLAWLLHAWRRPKTLE